MYAALISRPMTALDASLLLVMSACQPYQPVSIAAMQMLL
jgi:hypothetical protein